MAVIISIVLSVIGGLAVILLLVGWNIVSFYTTKYIFFPKMQVWWLRQKGFLQPMWLHSMQWCCCLWRSVNFSNCGGFSMHYFRRCGTWIDSWRRRWRHRTEEDIELGRTAHERRPQQEPDAAAAPEPDVGRPSRSSVVNRILQNTIEEENNSASSPRYF